MIKDFKIYFERSGGFAGIQLKLELISNELPIEEKNKLIALIDSARFFEYNPENTEVGQHPDQFQYKISIETGDSARSVFLTGNQLPENWQPLIQYLDRKARIAPR